jgi:hypothetical protein
MGRLVKEEEARERQDRKTFQKMTQVSHMCGRLGPECRLGSATICCCQGLVLIYNLTSRLAKHYSWRLPANCTPHISPVSDILIK